MQHRITDIDFFSVISKETLQLLHLHDSHVVRRNAAAYIEVL